MQEETEDNVASPWNGFRVVGDNLDKTVRPHYMRVDHKTDSLHFFYMFAVRDCVNLSEVPDTPSSFVDVPVHQLPLDVLLPSSSDYQNLLNNFSVLISRVLVSHLVYFSNTFDGVVTRHISHEHTKEMSTKSETV